MPELSRMCQGFNTNPHEAVQSDYSPNAWMRGWKYCRACDSGYRNARKGNAKSAVSSERVTRRAPVAAAPVKFSDEAPPQSNDHEYVPDPELVALWNTVTSLTLNAGAQPANLLFLGPAGSGKTEGAKYLAKESALPFTKVDAASMTDPESWFGTREIIVQEGVSVTKYVPSAFAQAVAQAGVLFIDEMNRVDDEHRNVLLPLLDGTGKVTNPLTGEIIERHAHCFIIMAGNRGLQFTGISNIDPAFMTRSLTINFDYMPKRDEERIAMQATGCDADTAHVFVKFAGETRDKAAVDEDFAPISTREVIWACRLVAGGLSRDLAAKIVVLNAASSEGGPESTRQELQNIWNGVRLSSDGSGSPDDSAALPDSDWTCPVHQQVHTVPAGISKIKKKPYPAFRACPIYGCPHTEEKDRAKKTTIQLPNPQITAAQISANTINSSQISVTCGECGSSNSGGTGFCTACGATI